MRHTPAWLIGTSLLLSTVAPVRAGGPPVCEAPVKPGVWTPVFAPVNVDYTTHLNYAGHIDRGGAPYEIAVDPLDACHAFRAGTPDTGFTDRGLVQETTDGGHRWVTVVDKPAPFAATHVYVPADGVVYVSEDGDGTAVLRRDKDCPQWCPANGGIVGQHVHTLTFAPSRPATAYAVTLPCKAESDTPLPPLPTAADPSCERPETTVGQFLGRVALWKTTNGGTTWAPVPIPDPGTARNEFSVQVDPGDPDAPYIYDRPDAVLTQGQPRILSGRKLDVIPTAVRTKHRYFRAFRRGGKLLLLAREDGGHDVVSEDGGRTFPQAGGLYGTEATPTLPLPDGRLFGLHIRKHGKGGEGHDARAAWSTGNWDPYRVEYGRFPSWLPVDYAYALETTQRGADGTLYVTVGRECHTNGYDDGDTIRCYPGEGKPPPFGRSEWITWAYRIPDDARSTEIAPPNDPTAAPPSCVLPTCAAPAGPVCSLPEGAAGAGLAYDGRDLVYPVDAATPATVAFRRVDAATCEPRPDRITIPLDKADHAKAVERTRRHYVPGRGEPTLDKTYADADTVTFDPATGRMFFSLRDNAKPGSLTTQGNPASVWVWSGDGAAQLMYVGERCLRDEKNRSGMDLLAWDADDGSLLTCADARPLPITTDGRPLTPYCVARAPFRGFGYGWPITSWTDAENHKALVLLDRGQSADIASLDLTDCSAGVAAYSVAAVAEAKPIGGHTQLACTPPRAATDPTLLWQRVGDTARSYGMPDPAHWCRVPTAIRVTTSATETCATLLAPGPRDPSGMTVSGRRVDIRVDGANVPAPLTDEQGSTCVPAVATRDAGAGFAGDWHYLKSAGTWPPTPVPPVVRPPRVAPPPPPGPNPPVENVPPLPGPNPPAVQQAPQPGVPVPPPAPAPPGANVGGLTENREEQQQLAFASQDVTETEEAEPAAELLAAVGLIVAAATAVALRRRAAAATASVEPAYRSYW